MIMHKCVIGLLHDYDSTNLVSLDGLKEHIQSNRQQNEWIDKDPVLKDCEELKSKIYSLKDYADKRKATDLTRFDFCPECGQKIGWEAIKRGDEI